MICSQHITILSASCGHFLLMNWPDAACRLGDWHASARAACRLLVTWPCIARVCRFTLKINLLRRTQIVQSETMALSCRRWIVFVFVCLRMQNYGEMPISASALGVHIRSLLGNNERDRTAFPHDKQKQLLRQTIAID